MGLEHLSDDELETLERQGLPGLPDEALSRLELPRAYQHPSYFEQMKQVAASQLHAVNGALEKTPIVKEITEAGKYVKPKVQGMADKLEGYQNSDPEGFLGSAMNDLSHFSGTALSGLAEAIPDTGIGTAALLAPEAGKLAGAAKAALPAEKLAASGARPLLTGEAAEAAAGAAQGSTGVPLNAARAVLEDPDILARALHPEKAGEIMNQVAEQFGVQSGADALKMIPAVKGKAIPSLSNAGGYADEVFSNMQKIEDLQQLKAIRDRVLSLGTKNVSSTADHAADMAWMGKDSLSRAGDMTFPQNVGRTHADVLVEDDLNKWIGDLEKPFAEGGAPKLQDLVSARQYMSKTLSRPKFQSMQEGIMEKLGTENMGKIDDAIEKMSGKLPQPIEVPGYGKVETFAQARKIYHEAMIANDFKPWFAQNANKTTSALRMLAGIATAVGNPAAGVKMAAAQSPRMWANAIKAAAYMRDLEGPSARGMLGAIENAAPSAEAAAAGPLAGLAIRKDEE